MNAMRTILLALVLIGLTACEPLETPTPVAAPTPTPAVKGEAASGTLPLPDPFDVDWDERTLFEAGLKKAERGVLEELPAASIYHIDFAIDAGRTRLDGREAVRYTNAEAAPLEEIVFRLYPNLTGGGIRVSNVQVDGLAVEPRYEGADSVMRVPLNRPLQPGERRIVTMDFTVEVPTDESSNYGIFAYLDETLALAHFYPQVAVYDDEGWNVEIPAASGDVVYADASFYLVRVDGPAELVMVASGVVLTQAASRGRQTMIVAAGPARDFYLAANEDYTAASQTVAGIRINSYGFPETSAGAGRVLATAIDSVKSYQRHFGPYPYSELDLVPTATSALGVEYPGIIAIAQRIYAEDALDYLEGTTAHEVAHQWFYNVVGNDQVDEPWLDEALAQYATLLYFEDRYGEEGYTGFRESLTERWARVDNANIPIGLPVAEYEGREYGAIVYGRGPLFFEALEKELGERAFAAFLRDYYETQRWGIATPESLKALAETNCACDLTTLFEAWVYE